MSNAYSPVRRCEAQHAMVRVNQTQRECALENSCPPGRNCPLAGCFANVTESRSNPGVFRTMER
jgi:hypothetical protein